MDTKNSISFCVVLIFTGLVYAFSGGDGTADNPYQISTIADLEAVNNDLSANYILINDIDLSSKVYDDALIAPKLTGVMQGDMYFKGIFKGNGFKITGLKIDTNNIDREVLGLFGYVAPDAIVSDLSAEGLDIATTSGSLRVGGLCGMNFGAINNCQVQGTIRGYSVGGVCGVNSGIIISCHSNSTVNGLAGSVRIGGLCGHNLAGIIYNSYADGDVIGENGSVLIGGFVGGNSGEISDSYSTCAVNGKYNCETIGGFSGSNSGYIKRCYSIGQVSAANASYVGGFCAANSRVISDSFWNFQTSQQMMSYGGIAKATSQLLDISTYISSGWDFAGESSDGVADIWYKEQFKYPQINRLAKNYVPLELSGDGTVNSPFEIYDERQLYSVNQNIFACYKLMNDLSMRRSSDRALIPVFSGRFDGNSFAVKNLKINGQYNVGLFGINDGVIMTLGLTDIVINGAVNYAGSLAACNFGAIRQCYSTGTIQGKYYVGGLCGYDYSAEIENSFSTVTVNGDAYVGGLVGRNYSSIIENCYVNNKIIGRNYVGGICADNDNFASVINCFWDTTVSGLISSTGGTGKTTYQMLQPATYTSSGWDFLGETYNGTEDIWVIPEDGAYPVLNSAYSVADFNYDERIDYDDYDIFMSQWLQSGQGLICDIYPAGLGDERVDVDDLIMFTDMWEQEIYLQACKGDFDYDYAVNIGDLFYIADKWLFIGGKCDIAPVGGDGIVNILDWSIMAKNWLMSD